MARTNARKLSLRLARMVPDVTLYSWRHCCAGQRKRLRRTGVPPMTPQRGQHGSPFVDGQRARMNHRYASSPFIAAALASDRPLAFGERRKCWPGGQKRYFPASRPDFHRAACRFCGSGDAGGDFVMGSGRNGWHGLVLAVGDRERPAGVAASVR